MAWSEKLKLNKQLIRAVTDAGYLSPKEIQQKSLPRIFGGQDLIAVGPEGCGKTTTYVLAVLNKFKYDAEGVPRVLILVPEKDDVAAVIETFELLNKTKPLSIVGLYAAPGTETQMNALADGADIVVATPDRARAIYLKLGLNLNKIELLVIDDAERIVKQGLQLPVAELANSITKGQHLVFAEVMHNKVEKMIAPFMKLPGVVEVEEATETVLETCSQLVYHVPNFGTKLNLLNLFMQDEDIFTKLVIFVNTRHTAETICKTLLNRKKNPVAILNSPSVEFNNLPGSADFLSSPDIKVMIVIGDEPVDLTHIPFLLHFDVPEETEKFTGRVAINSDEDADETLAITFATDIELSLVKKIERALGKKLPVADIPEAVLIEAEKKAVNEKTVEKKEPEAPAGPAFHEKKASNLKTHNYGGGVKAKMNNKKKHS